MWIGLLLSNQVSTSVPMENRDDRWRTGVPPRKASHTYPRHCLRSVHACVHIYQCMGSAGRAADGALPGLDRHSTQCMVSDPLFCKLANEDKAGYSSPIAPALVLMLNHEQARYHILSARNRMMTQVSYCYYCKRWTRRALRAAVRYGHFEK